MRLSNAGKTLIIYQASKTDFLNHTLRDDIEDIVSRHYSEATGRSAGPPELRAWKNSLFEMAKVLQDEDIPDDAGVAIEYQLPQTSKRIDFVIAGEDDQNRPTVVIIELKQWSDSRRSDKDALIWARRGGSSGEREGTHPCYQAWSYASYLQDFNTAVQEGAVTLRPCAYLHNHARDGEIDHPHYQRYIEKAPLFLARERHRLQQFIRQHVRFGDRRKNLYLIDNGKIRPSKMLADSVKGMLQGKAEFVMIDDQKVIYETVLATASLANSRKQVVIVQGGPGTGKSVVAVNLLTKLIERQRNARYVSKNAAPRAVYEAKLAGSFRKSRISNLFTGSGSFQNTASDTYDALIVDEAHRLNEKSGLYRNQGDHQIREIVKAARCAVFFVDDDQRVTIHDIGHTEEIRRIAAEAGAAVTDLNLSSQFRCNGSDGYLAWLDDTLDIRRTANDVLDTAEYDFRVFDSPADMHALIEKKNRSNNRSRVVAGYCWKWPSKKTPAPHDIVIEEFDYRRRWNLDKDGSLWIIAPNSVEEVGCIHTCQGLELDYVGVIIGPDLVVRDGKVIADASRRAPSDQSVRGLKKMMRENPAKARRLGDLIVKNTYRTLLTRGIKGCFVYCTDPTLATYLKSRVRPVITAEETDESDETVSTFMSSELPFRFVTTAERELGQPALPLIELKRSVNQFASAKSLEVAAIDWVTPPDWITPQSGMFVAKLPSDSTGLDGLGDSWGLFRFPSGELRDGATLLVVDKAAPWTSTPARYQMKIYCRDGVAEKDNESGQILAELLATFGK